jgi:hypothetical protein
MLVVIADHEGAELAPVAASTREPTDDEVLLVTALVLLPGAASLAGLVA